MNKPSHSASQPLPRNPNQERLSVAIDKAKQQEKESWKLHKSYKNAGEEFASIASKVKALWACLGELINEIDDASARNANVSASIWALFDNWYAELGDVLNQQESAMVVYRSIQAAQAASPWGQKTSLLTPEYNTEIHKNIDCKISTVEELISEFSRTVPQQQKNSSNGDKVVPFQIKAKLDAIYKDIVEGRKDPSYIDVLDQETLMKNIADDTITEIDVEQNKELVFEWLSRVQQKHESSDVKSKDEARANHTRSRSISPPLSMNVDSEAASSFPIADGAGTVDSPLLLDDAINEIGPQYETGTAYTIYSSYEQDKQDFQDDSPKFESIASSPTLDRTNEHSKKPLKVNDKSYTSSSATEPTFSGARSTGIVTQNSTNSSRDVLPNRATEDGTLSTSHAHRDQSSPPSSTEQKKKTIEIETEENKTFLNIISRNVPSNVLSKLPVIGQNAIKTYVEGPQMFDWPSRKSPELDYNKIVYVYENDERCRPTHYVRVACIKPTLNDIATGAVVGVEYVRLIPEKHFPLVQETPLHINAQSDRPMIHRGTLWVPLRKGIRAGMRIILPGQGDYIKDESHDGYKDLHLIIYYNPLLSDTEHLIMRRNGDDVHQTFSITLCEALCGWKRDISLLPQPDGITPKFEAKFHDCFFDTLREGATLKTTMVSLICTSSDWRKKLEGLGLPNYENPEKRGDMYIRIRIAFPRELSKSQKKLIRQALEPQGGLIKRLMG